MEIKQRTNISEKIATDIKDKIINGEFKRGERLPSEFTLCKIYNASRSTIRSTLQILVTLGFVETKFGSGSYVKNNKNLFMISETGGTSLFDIYILRKMLEPNVCKHICEKISADEISELVKIVAQIEKNKDNESEMKSSITLFHLKLAQLTKNNYIIETMNKIFIDLGHYAEYKIVSNIEIYYHKEIVKLLLQKDIGAVHSVMSIYIDEFWTNIN